jgi:transcriptional regulator with XRE-family HTH domain
MKRAPNKLRAWQREQGLTDAEAGARFGTTRMTWLRWKSGEMVPGPAFMIELYGERVAEPNDFYDLPDLAVDRNAA